MSAFRLSRRALIGGVVSSGGLLLSGCNEQAPTYGSILRMGDNFTYDAQRLLLSKAGLVREYDRSEITSMPATGMIDPGQAKDGDEYARLRRGDFAGWRLEVGGNVAEPRSFSLAELKRLRGRNQITRHTCEEGWTAIAEWNGVPLAALLAAVAIRPSARFVQFHSFDGWKDQIDMVDALHPQTLLAYGMNGHELPIGHGAPLRLRVERQIGYRSMKFLKRIVAADHFDDFGATSRGWAWHTGI
ncbi:MAG: molybdopterin-dependent oxidoreductase [Candidatus Andeanibacterium colombiense]|uniref:Molybdopterin-dependent oxidoreductase n=1 Tax=Candidatus Andeanibacterium colombiense TaxID=3121345 RepID=A0AAJ5X8F0_9SPHN|nr:MAG: molybdopterin-dependent oxidoreductase [Sphingomonadaceae bacterium]